MSDARQVNMWKHDYLIALVTSLATMMTRRSKKKKKTGEASAVHAFE